MELDTLTGIPTRAYLSEVSAEFASSPAAEPWSALMIDVDHFKLVNDMHGHLAGDSVLRMIAGIIRSCVRQEDVAVRFGGDEFLVVLKGTGGEGALTLGQRLVDESAALVFPGGLRITISVGVADRRNSDALIEEMIERADRALYAAKESGRGRISFMSHDEDPLGRAGLSFNQLVGRRQELKKLRQVLDESTAYGSRITLLSGEPGVGKTRLVTEVERFCRFRRSSVLRGRCMEFYESQPYSLLVIPLRERMNSLTAREMEAFRKSVEPLHPATLELFPDFPAAIRDDTQYFREERLRFRILEDLSKMLAGLAAFGHTVVVLEDLQWITGPDLELLCFVVRNTTESPILFLTTLRTGTQGGPAIVDRILSLRTSLPVMHIQMANLDEAEARNLVMFAIHDPNVPASFVRMLYRQSGGNPLFLREFLIALSEDGCIVHSPDGTRSYRVPSAMNVPESLTDVIGQKLSRVPEQDLSMLRMASITSGAFPAGLISAVSGADELSTAGFIDRNLRAGLLVEMHSVDGEPLYGFSHDAIRSFLGSELSEVMRRALHQRMGAYFEGLCVSGREEYTAAAAFHLGAGGAGEKASRFSLAAARQALRQRANREAIRWYETFLSQVDEASGDEGDLREAWRQLGELLSVCGEGGRAEVFLKKAVESASGEETAEINALLGHNCHRESRYPEARDYYVRALEASADQFLKGEVTIAMAFLDYLSGDFHKGLARLSQAEDIVGETPEGHPRSDMLRALLYTRMGDITNALNPGKEALPHYEKAIALCRAHGDRLGEARALNNISDVYMQMGDYEKSLQVLMEVLEVNERYDDALGVAIACFNIADTYSRMNQIALAREYFQRYLEVSGRIHNELGEGYGNLGLGLLHTREGDIRAAEQAFRKAAATFERLGSMSMCSEARLRLAETLVAMGRLDEAGMLVDRLDEEWLGGRENSYLKYMQGLLALRGRREVPPDPARAVELLRSSLRNTAPLAEQDIATRFLVLAEALVSAGRADEAAGVLTEGRAAVEEKLTHTLSPVVRDSIRSIPAIRSLLSR